MAKQRPRTKQINEAADFLDAIKDTEELKHANGQCDPECPFCGPPRPREHMKKTGIVSTKQATNTISKTQALKLANKIAKHLFTSGKRTATRLVLMDESTKPAVDLGGWGQGACARAIFSMLYQEKPK